MKDKNTQTELEDNIKYGILDALETLNSQTEDDTECVIIEIDEDEASQLRLDKKDLVDMVCAKIKEMFPLSLIFDRYEDNGDPCFKISDFQKHKIAAYNKLKKSYRDNIAYLKDYKYLIVSCGFGIIGEISNIEMNQIHEAAYMVDRLNCMYDLISTNFAELKDLYFKEYDV